MFQVGTALDQDSPLSRRADAGGHGHRHRHDQRTGRGSDQQHDGATRPDVRVETQHPRDGRQKDGGREHPGRVEATESLDPLLGPALLLLGLFNQFYDL